MPWLCHPVVVAFVIDSADPITQRREDSASDEANRHEPRGSNPDMSKLYTDKGTRIMSCARRDSRGSRAAVQSLFRFLFRPSRICDEYQRAHEPDPQKCCPSRGGKLDIIVVQAQRLKTLMNFTQPGLSRRLPSGAMTIASQLVRWIWSIAGSIQA